MEQESHSSGRTGVLVENDHRSPIHFIRKVNRIAYDHLLPALLCLVPAYATVTRLISSINSAEWFSSLRLALVLAFFLLISLLFITRYPIQSLRARPFEALVALLGTFAPVLFSLIPLRHPDRSILILGDIVIILGYSWSLFSLAGLGRSFGLFPEVRGLVTRGPYKIVRHPLYLVELVALFGLMLPVFSPLAMVLFILAAGLQIWRTYFEERALLPFFPEYASYVSRTARIIPWIW